MAARRIAIGIAGMFLVSQAGCGLFSLHQTARVLEPNEESVQLSIDQQPVADFDGRVTASDLRYAMGLGKGWEGGFRYVVGGGLGIDLKKQVTNENSESLPISTAASVSALIADAGEEGQFDLYNGQIMASRVVGRFEPYGALRYQYTSLREDPNEFREHTRHAILGTRIDLGAGFFIGVEGSYVDGERDDGFVFGGTFGYRWIPARKKTGTAARK